MDVVPAPIRRRRSGGRYLRNEAALIAAAIDILAGGGWAALTFNGVSRAANLSVRPVQYRYGTKIGLAVALWNGHLADGLEQWLGSLHRFAGLEDEAPDAAALTMAFVEADTPSVPLRAAIELLVVANFHDALAEAIRPRLLGVISRGSDDPVRAAQRTYLTAVALGVVLSAPRRRHRSDVPCDWRGWVDLLLARFAAPKPVSPVEIPPRPVIADPVLDEKDPRLNALLRACMLLVSERGFDGASTQEIATASGFTEGLLFGRYPSKAALMIDAVTRLQASTMVESLAWQREWVERVGPDATQAVNLVDILRPERRRARAIAVEYERMAAHDASVRERVRTDFDAAIAAFVDAGDASRGVMHAAVIAAIAVGLGMCFLALADPDVRDLPFVAVML